MGSNNNNTMATTNLKRNSSRSFELSSWEIQIDSDTVSVHWQFPFRADALLDFAIDLPVSTETIDTKSLSHPFGTCYHKILVFSKRSDNSPHILDTQFSQSLSLNQMGLAIQYH